MICLTGRSDIGFSFYRQEACRLDVCLAVWINLSLHELDVERDGHLVANENATGLKRRVHGQAALYGEFSVPDKADARGLERQRGELLHVEEVGALQVRIALGVPRFDR